MSSTTSRAAHAETLRRVAETLLLASQTLARNPVELSSQLLGRLPACDDEALQPLLQAARSWRAAAWLRPVASSLSPPRAPLARLLAGHEGTPRSVAVSPNGLVGASAGNSNPDQAVYVWDIHRGAALHVFREEAEPGGRTPIALTGDGRTLLTGYGGEIRVFDVAAGERRPSLARRDVAVTALAAAAGAEVCVAGWADGELTVWDLDGGRSRRLSRAGEAALALSVAPDGGYAAVGTVDSLELVDLRLGRIVARRECETGISGSFAEDAALALSADGRRIYHGAPPRTWDVNEDTISGGAVGDDALRVLAISPGGRVVSAPRIGDEGGLVVRDLGGDADRRDLPHHPSFFSAAAVTPDGQYALCADYDHWVTFWRLDALDAPRPASRHRERVWRLTVAETDAVSASVGGDLKAWSLADGREVDGATAGAALADARRRWADADALDAELSREAPLRTGGARRWAQTPDGRLAVGSTWDPQVKPSEAEEPLEAVGTQRLPVRHRGGERAWLTGHSSPIVAVAVSDDGRRALSAGFGRIVRVWDLETATQLHAMRGHAGVVWDACAVPGGRWAVTASEDRTVVLWDLEQGVRIASFTGDHAMLRCAVDPSGTYVVAGDVAGGVHVLRIELPSER